ncbi:hypothetical protein [Paenibacillus koleovorans]|uniref:hypothetical protein n=1 Tax=Paenibacillus koleovorans TaxID=121608 RepID=UPI000FDA9254|nr:hypothetical protein [Paenibacillus koleovorans]
MTVYWLTPVDRLQPFVLGADRISCAHGDRLDEFCGRLKRIHPRLLMPYKAELLPGDPGSSEQDSAEADRCGMDRVPFALSDTGPIRFDGPAYGLSECAQAMVERLVDSSTAYKLLQDHNPIFHDPVQNVWLAKIRQWLLEGKPVLLIREEGRR